MELTFIPTRKMAEEEAVPTITLSKVRLAISKKLQQLFEQHNINNVTALAVGQDGNGYLYLVVNRPENGVKLNQLKNGEIISNNSFFIEEIKKKIFENRFLPADKINTNDTDALLKVQIGSGVKVDAAKNAFAFPFILASIKQVVKEDKKGGAKK